jgi:Cft2 family RNA processing exonuclease
MICFGGSSLVSMFAVPYEVIFAWKSISGASYAIDNSIEYSRIDAILLYCGVSTLSDGNRSSSSDQHTDCHADFSLLSHHITHYSAHNYIYKGVPLFK